MAGLSTSRWLQLSFLFMASSAAAKSLTLSDFESITSSSFPLDCVQAYDTPLSHCLPGDFTGGKACSAACKDSVSQAQGFIRDSCSGLSADAESLLARGQKGNLVMVLCRDADEPQTDPEPEPATMPPTATVTSTRASKSKDHIMVETSTSSVDKDSVENINGDPLSSVNEDLATQSTVLAIDTDQPTMSMPPPPSALSTSMTKATEASRTSETSSESGSATPSVPAAGSIHPPSLGFMCASFAMSTLMYLGGFN
ncbi:hypothetical protein FZEAL_2707 [Fusarium zealandicum]|uniref:Uncharacterized protein n=1 Tax=Fusarium zealandicum TaxID=1053134 RepID=A0A8H4UQ33_9HYPO|nr:hypothetical protein FZEAL_2707 [Fusarium zealandicum]